MSRKQDSSMWGLIRKIYSKSCEVLQKDPTILFLFILVGILDLLALSVLFLIPSIGFLSPIVRTLWGERFLHYPENFLLLPKLFNYAHFIILTLIGVLLTSVAIKKIQACYDNSRISLVQAGKVVIRKYFGLMAIWLLFYGVFMVAMRFILSFLPPVIFLQFAVAFLFSLIIQSVFVFLMPAYILLGSRFLKAIWEGFLLGLKRLHITCLLISVPMFAMIVLSFLKSIIPAFVQVVPEMVLWVLFVGVVVSTVVDLLVTTSTTILFLEREKSIL